MSATAPIDPPAYWSAAASALMALFGSAPRFRAYEAAGGVMAMSGEPVADLNMGLVWKPDKLPGLLREMGSHAEVPFLLLLGEAAAPQCLGRETDYGCTDCGRVPLMVHRAPTPQSGTPHAQVTVAQAADAAALAVIRSLISSAFQLDPGPVARAFGDDLLARADVASYLARDGEEPVSAVMVTRHPQGTGIWSMATPSGSQRKGYGHALLTEVMRRERARGAGEFYLFATPAGEPLYTRLGYATVEAPQVWLRGESTQA